MFESIKNALSYFVTIGTIELVSLFIIVVTTVLEGIRVKSLKKKIRMQEWAYKELLKSMTIKTERYRLRYKIEYELKEEKKHREVVEAKKEINYGHYKVYTEKYVIKKFKDAIIIMICFILGSAFSLYMEKHMQSTGYNYELLNVISIVFVGLVFLQCLVEFIRVKMGLFGTCYQEAKKLIKFINKDKKNGNYDSGIAIFNSEQEYIEQQIVNDAWEVV